MIKRNNMRMTVMSVAIGLALLTGCSATSTNNNTNESGVTSTVDAVALSTTTQSNDIQVEYAEDDYYTDWKGGSVTTVTLDGNKISVEGAGAQVQDSTLTITSGGTYVISGQLSDGQIVIDSQDKQTVRIVLNGAEINCLSSAPIYVKQAEKAVLSLEAGTNNSVSDTANYILEADSDEPDATIFSKADLTINGTGTLTIAANYNNGITSKDDLKIMEGTINVSAVGDAIKGKDMVAIKDGNITINATEDGIKSTNSTDSGKGFVYVEGGKLDITAGNDGIQAETDIKILGGDFKLNTGGGSSNGVSHAEDAEEGRGTRPADAGMTRPADAGTTKPADEGTTVPEDAGMTKPEDAGMTRPVDAGTTVPEDAGMTKPANEGTTAPENEGIVAQGPNNIVETPGATGEINTSENTVSSASDATTEDTTSTSYKGIKATNAITIEGGTFDINAADDAIHSNNSVTIQDGNFVIETGDDGIHADTLLAIDGGTININKSYEGIESAEINVAGGVIYVTASDDGVNAADGTSETIVGGRPGESSGTAKITISGGYLYIDNNGDGIDSNGSISMAGGTVIVNGPSNGGNGALDYDDTFDISGGTLIAVAGSARMAQTISSTSSQKTVTITFANSQEANSLVNLQDEAGNTILSFAPSKAYQSVVISSPLLEEGKTYSFSYGGSMSGDATDGLYQTGTYTGGTKVTDFTISDAITYLSETGVTTGGSGFGKGGSMQPGNGQGRRGDRKPEESTDIESGNVQKDNTSSSSSTDKNV